ncbi:MAG: tetratricopeptide repeat protein [Acidobacteriia bacterium]|nr:tetratricopeptide repeat protein [Terriglobia bacterium]
MQFRPLIALTLTAVSATALCAQPAKQERGQLDASPALFTVLAAINAAGYDDGLDSPSAHPLRKAIRAEIARRKLPVVDKIREFMGEHRQENALWELRQYISFALLVEDPPNFAFRIKEHQLPPDIAALKDLIPLLTAFYKEAGVEELWQRSQPAFEEVIAKYQQPATRAVQQVAGYLRSPPTGIYPGQRFQIFLDLLGAPNQIHPRTFLNEYYIVVTPAPEPQYNDMRQAYLHFMLDQLVTNHQDKLLPKSALLDYALGAPYLASHFKEDFLLLATRSLIRAIEARLAPSAQRQAMLDQAMGEGFILTAYFGEQLPLYEKQEQSMRLYYPELIKGIDLKKEELRLEKLEFSKARPERKAPPAPKKAEPELSAVEKTLAEAEDLYTRRDLIAAREAYLKAVSLTAEKPVHAKAYYGLARIATLNRDPELAVKLFEKTMELNPEPAEKSWSLYYLGRLAHAAGDEPQAARRFREALAVEGSSRQLKQAAEKSLQETVK